MDLSSDGEEAVAVVAEMNGVGGVQGVEEEVSPQSGVDSFDENVFEDAASPRIDLLGKSVGVQGVGEEISGQIATDSIDSFIFLGSSAGEMPCLRKEVNIAGGGSVDQVWSVCPFFSIFAYSSSNDN